MSNGLDPEGGLAVDGSITWPDGRSTLILQGNGGQPGLERAGADLHQNQVRGCDDAGYATRDLGGLRPNDRVTFSWIID
jgi:hypothetical protein